MIKIDTLDNQPINTNIIKKFQKFIKEDKSDAMIFSDFRHGIFQRKYSNISCLSLKKYLKLLIVSLQLGGGILVILKILI